MNNLFSYGKDKEDKSGQAVRELRLIFSPFWPCFCSRSVFGLWSLCRIVSFSGSQTFSFSPSGNRKWRPNLPQTFCWYQYVPCNRSSSFSWSDWVDIPGEIRHAVQRTVSSTRYQQLLVDQLLNRKYVLNRNQQTGVRNIDNELFPGSSRHSV